MPDVYVRVREWRRGELEPEGVSRVQDCDGDQWLRAKDDTWHLDSGAGMWFRWDRLVALNGPLREVLAIPNRKTINRGLDSPPFFDANPNGHAPEEFDG